MSAATTPGSAFIAVDLGATSGRVMLGVLVAARVELVECARFGNRAVAGDDGGLRWDIEALWTAILDGLREAGRVAAERGVEVRGIGVDSWAVDHGLLDDDGVLLADPWCYRDSRTAESRAAVYGRIPFAEHYAVNGLQDLPFTTMFQLVAEARRGAVSVAGTAPAESDWSRTACVLMIPDLITYRLTGHRVAEVTNASTTGLVDATTRTWADTHIARLVEEFPELGDLRARLPRLVEPGTVVGLLVAEIREVTGLGDVPVYAVGSHDTASAVAGTPLGDADGGTAGRVAAYISSGTWSLVGLELDAPVLTDESRAANFTNELGVGRTVRYLRNVMGLWVLDECVREWSQADVAAGGEPVDLAALLDAAAREPGGCCLLDVEGEEFLTPGDMVGRVRAAILASAPDMGFTPDQRPAMVRVILDSLAAAYAGVIRRAGLLAGVTVTAIHVVGGGSRNDLLNRLTAQATGLPVHAGPVEATALGNILVQADASGTTSSPMRDIVRASTDLRVTTGGA